MLAAVDSSERICYINDNNYLKAGFAAVILWAWDKEVLRAEISLWMSFFRLAIHYRLIGPEGKV